MSDLEAVRVIAQPILSERGLELIDVEIVGSGRARTLRVTVDRAEDRAGAVDLEALAAATAPLSIALDATTVVSGPYQLEVSSPGLERPLRRPGEFRRFLGTTISLKSHESNSGARRHRGRLLEADDEGVALDVDGERRRFRHEDIASARTVFEWGPTPKPGGKRTPRPSEKRLA